MYHMWNVSPMTLHESVAHEAGLVQRCGQHRPVTDALEGEPVVRLMASPMAVSTDTEIRRLQPQV